MVPTTQLPKRLVFQQAFDLTKLSDENPRAPGSPLTVTKFMSRQPAWSPGGELVWGPLSGRAPLSKASSPRAFGGHAYAQASLAAARVMEAEDVRNKSRGRKSIHSIQGVFSNAGFIDRPFIYEVSKLSSTSSFSSALANAYQPIKPSSQARGPFPLSDQHLPTNEVCFSCLVTFKLSYPGPDEVQSSASPQQRFAHILASRAPTEWPPSPAADIDIVREAFPDKDHGTFPVLDMYKVDMTEYNSEKLLPDRRELILYRLMNPLPKDDLNAHILCHAYEADRNGLIMAGNHLGYGYNMGSAASLSCSFYVHTNAEEAVMEGDGFWVQEACWPRVSAGRCMYESRLWSPDGRHVATAYQDGIILPAKKKSLEEKL